jgi:Prophage CP4-57 regulatory protein (AlpA)
MSDKFVLKMVISVSAMATAVGLSRARFYQLMDQGTFPRPDKEPTTGRPFYSEEKQRLCLEVRRRNCGIDGKPILFHKQRRHFGSGKRKSKRDVKGNDVADLVAGLKRLGLTMATVPMVAEVRKQLYPNGTAGVDPGEVVKKVFLEIHRRGSVAGE